MGITVTNVKGQRLVGNRGVPVRGDDEPSYRPGKYSQLDDFRAAAEGHIRWGTGVASACAQESQVEF